MYLAPKKHYFFPKNLQSAQNAQIQEYENTRIHGYTQRETRIPECKNTRNTNTLKFGNGTHEPLIKGNQATVIWHCPSSIDHWALAIWHWSSGVCHLAFTIWHWPFDIGHLALAIRNWSFAIRHVAWTIWHWPFDIGHLTLAIWHRPCSIVDLASAI